MQNLIQDLRFGIRTLFKQPGFTLLAALTLALGIGANSAIFSVVNAVLLRPLAFHEADKIVNIYEAKFEPSQGQVFQGSVSVPNLLDWRAQNDVFTGIAAWQGNNFNLQGGADPERIIGANVSSEFFDVLGITPWRGRTFTADEDRQGNHRVAVLSYQLWQRNYGASPEIINQGISIGGETYTVIG